MRAIVPKKGSVIIELQVFVNNRSVSKEKISIDIKEEFKEEGFSL